MIQKFAIYIVIIFLIVACAGNDKIGDYKWNKIDSVKTASFKSDSLILSLFGFVQWQEHIVFEDTQKTKNRHFACFKIKGDSLILVDYFWRFGRGNRETISASHYRCDNSFYIKNYDNATQAKEIYKVNDISDLMDINKCEKVAVPSSNDIRDIVQINDKQLLVTLAGFQTEELFGILDSQTGELTELALKFPGIDDKVVRKNLVSMIYFGTVVKRHNKPEFVYSTQDGNCVFMFKIEDGKVADFREVYDIYPKYELSADGKNRSIIRDGLKGYKPAASQNNFYLLSRSENDKGGNEILVFDWDGKPVRKIILDRNVYAIDVNKDGTMLYTAGINEEGDYEFAFAKI